MTGLILSISIKSLPTCCRGIWYPNFFIQIMNKLEEIMLQPKEFVFVDGYKIHYEKIGNGSCVVLVLPGGFGNARADCGKLLDNINQKRFTIIAMDPQGYGYSRPPERVYDKDSFYELDANVLTVAMKKIGYDTFAVVGWSSGGIIGINMAIKHPNNIEKLVAMGSACRISNELKRRMRLLNHFSFWSKDRIEKYNIVYGDKMSQIWENHNKFLQTFENSCEKDLVKIRCPTMILHGDRDCKIEFKEAQILEKNIPDSRLLLIKNGNHDFPDTHFMEVIKLIEPFLLE